MPRLTLISTEGSGLSSSKIDDDGLARNAKMRKAPAAMQLQVLASLMRGPNCPLYAPLLASFINS